MAISCSVRISEFLKFSALCLLAGLASSLAAQETEQNQREQIGEVLGKPIYRDELKTQPLHDLVMSPVRRKYCEIHQVKIKPTEAEINAEFEFRNTKHREWMKEQLTEYRRQLEAVRQQLLRTDLTKEERKELLAERSALQGKLNLRYRTTAPGWMKRWKFQKHLYDEYGGGRILWTPVDVIAFDAMHKWLEDQEKQGSFRITDPELRASFYKFWESDPDIHLPFPDDLKKRIEKSFLEPEWLPKTLVKDRSKNSSQTFRGTRRGTRGTRTYSN